jgi:hypothetical protein
MLDSLGRLGAGIVLAALAMGLLAGSIYLADIASRRSGKTWVAWVVGIVVFVILSLIHALEGIGCRESSDYQGCMDGDYDSN